MLRYLIPCLFFSITFLGCSADKPLDDFSTIVGDSPSIEGKAAYLNSPFVTAGDRIYMVGHQNGSFPELGWHLTGEMGGIWDHPIKLMDGFEIALTTEGQTVTLDSATIFINYPFANQHLFHFPQLGVNVERWQFVPDGKEGLVVQIVLKNTTSATRDVQLQFSGYSDLRPTWLGERTQMIDGQDQMTYQEEEDSWRAKDSLNNWYVQFGADQTPTKSSLVSTPYGGMGAGGALHYDLTLSPNGTASITFTIAGSYVSETALLATYKVLQANYLSFLKNKKERYAALAEKSKLSIPDPQLQQTFEWLKYNSDWLIRNIPETGKGIMAGIPDYPWWFGVDSEYALKGYMAIGREDVVLPTIALLDSLSAVTNGNGRIVHEVSTNGAVFNPGNINETPQFASLIWEVYRWNGEESFLRKYFPTIQKGLQWLMIERDSNQNLFPEGFGMMEIHGLDSEMIDVAAYSQRALADAAKIARVLGEDKPAAQYQEQAQQLAAKINEEFWSEEFASYADFIGTDEQALHLIEDAIIRADTLDKPWAVEELKRTRESILANPSPGLKPFVLHHNWVVNTPMEMKIADPEKAILALETARRFVNPFGVFVTGIDRDESAGSDDGAFKGSKAFSYTGAVMTLPTGVQVVAENNYGRPDQALDYLQRMSRSFSYALPGSMYEVSPDYGMITQAWNIYSFAVPIVQQFFGIQPDAANKQVVIHPQMPSSWEYAKLENVEIADNEVSIFYKKGEKGVELEITQTNTRWTLQVALPPTDAQNITITKGELMENAAGRFVVSKGGAVAFTVK
ncbi:glycogen debranching protein [Lewinella sp. LCG006]|uniref:alpha-L-rhamnosidase-related protein n=1 Tax=Lewinella sp. LCG006 TaxID=3231911 RepID=UPI00345FC932